MSAVPSELAKTAVVVDERYGAGRVVAFAGEPNFRGFTDGTQKVLWNAVYGPDPAAMARARRRADRKQAARSANALATFQDRDDHHGSQRVDRLGWSDLLDAYEVKAQIEPPQCWTDAVPDRDRAGRGEPVRTSARYRSRRNRLRSGERAAALTVRSQRLSQTLALSVACDVAAVAAVVDLT